MCVGVGVFVSRATSSDQNMFWIVKSQLYDEARPGIQKRQIVDHLGVFCHYQYGEIRNTWYLTMIFCSVLEAA